MGDEAGEATGTTVPAEYFRTLYRTTADPWNFAGSAYEREKYAATLAALPRSRYARALELGCSIGVFTAQLAPRCEQLLAVDVSADAVAAAAERCRDLPGVRVEECDLAQRFPDGRYDLIAFCELGFYFGGDDFERIARAVTAALEPGGTLVLVHWTPPVRGHALRTDDVHARFLRSPAFAPLRGERAETYRLDVLERVVSAPE